MLVFKSIMPHELPISHASRQQQKDDQMWVKEEKRLDCMDCQGYGVLISGAKGGECVS
jgi:hypothetical protein